MRMPTGSHRGGLFFSDASTGFPDGIWVTPIRRAVFTSKPGALTLPRVFECTGTRVVSNGASASEIRASRRHACRSTGEPFGPLDGVHALGFLPGLI